MAYFIRKNDDGKEVYGVDFDIEVKECKQADDGKRIVSMVGSTPSVDRDGDTIRQQGWDTKAFKSNSVILWGHDHHIPAIARANKFKKSPEALVFEEIEFPKEGIHPFADMIYSLMEAKFIKAGSVGFIPTDMEKREREEGETDMGWCPIHFKKQELLEFSIVNVGSNRDALVTHLGTKGFKTTGKVKIGEQEFEMKQLINALFATEEKTVIRFKHYPLADEDTAWNGPREIREADVAQLKKMSTWFDGEEPDVKASYKLPHHQASDLLTVWNGVRAGMGVLFGARGGVDVPEGDRKGIFQHLASHYREFDKEVPEFKAYEEAELKEMFSNLFDEKDIAEASKGVEIILVELKEGALESEHRWDSNCPDVLFDKFSRKNCIVKYDDKGIDYIYGIKNDKSTLISMRYDKEVWTADDARKHCKDKGGTFEAAKGKTVDIPVKLSRQAEEALVSVIDKTKAEILAELEKAGAVLSRANKTKLNNAVKAINDVLAAAEPAATDGEHGDDDKSQPPEEIISKQVLAKLEELEATVTKLSDLFHAKEKPAVDEIDLEKIKAPSEKINLEVMELPQEEVDMEMLSKALQEIKQESIKSIKDTITKEIRKATGIVD